MQKLFAVFHDEINLYLLEEYVLGVGGLEAELKKYRRFGEEKCGSIAKQIVDFYQFVHAEGYVHRNMGLNTIAEAFEIVKVVDFSWIAQLATKRFFIEVMQGKRHFLWIL